MMCLAFTLTQLAVEAALRAMRTFPWDRLIQQRSCTLLVRLFPAHGQWLVEHCRRDEGARLRRVAKSLRAQLEMDDDDDDDDGGGSGGEEGNEDSDLARMAAKNRCVNTTGALGHGRGRGSGRSLAPVGMAQHP
jgi:hypothetical protein